MPTDSSGPLPSAELYKSWYARRHGKQPVVTESLQVVMSVVDHHNELHLHDRNALRGEIRALRAELAALRPRSTAVHEPEAGRRKDWV